VAGFLKAIWIKRAPRGPMDPVYSAHAVAGEGLVGNANQKGRRQVTLISAESWQEAERELGARLDPRLRRANLLVGGIDLVNSRGRTLRIGSTTILIRGETKPCNRMEEGHPGLRAALEPEWRAGAYGEVLEGGEIRPGDEVRWMEEET
jgi:MOSC domain-containing protein YiiM